MRSYDVTRWLRAGGLAFAVLALLASAVQLSREGRSAVTIARAVMEFDPLAVELERCNAITAASGRGDACERAWAENRKRFLGASRQTRTAPAAATKQSGAEATGDRP